jgi:hypothetical protein
MSLILEDNGVPELLKEASRASITAAQTSFDGGSLVAVKSSAGGAESGGGGLLTAPSLSEAIIEQLSDDIIPTLKKAPSVRSSLGEGKAIVVDLKPTPGSTPLK